MGVSVSVPAFRHITLHPNFAWFTRVQYPCSRLIDHGPGGSSFGVEQLHHKLEDMRRGESNLVRVFADPSGSQAGGAAYSFEEDIHWVPAATPTQFAVAEAD